MSSSARRSCSGPDSATSPARRFAVDSVRDLCSSWGVARWLLTTALILASLTVAASASASLSFVRSWGTLGTDPGQFSAPQAIAVDASGDVWVVDTGNSRIQHFDRNGNYLTSFGSYGGGAGQFGRPQGIAIAPDGTIYVADTANGRIQKLDQNGVFLGWWPLQPPVSNPTGVAVGPGGAVYVADATGNRVQVFDPNASLLTTFGQFNGPAQMATDATDHVYVADANNHRVQKLNNSGGVVRNMAPPDGFGSPAAVALDGSGNVFASDSTKNRIVKFTAAGGFVSSSGTKGSGDGQLGAPAGIAVRNQDMYVVETANNRVSQYLLTPDPVLGSAMTGEPIAGTVTVKVPASKSFAELAALDSLPIGTVVDASGGTVRITATDGTQTFTADFSGGSFQLAQRKKRGSTADIKLAGGSFKSCPKSGTIRGLQAKGGGAFRTIGRYSAGSAQTATWTTEDQCAGTLSRVAAGTLTVRDNVKRKTVRVKSGARYLARAK